MSRDIISSTNETPVKTFPVSVIVFGFRFAFRFTDDFCNGLYQTVVLLGYYRLLWYPKYVIPKIDDTNPGLLVI